MGNSQLPMIKFFRRIRQKLLSENKFSKYFVYAIGEIVLVVIGILIALQINNWNQERLNSVEEQNYYKNIKRQLSEDRRGIESSMSYNNSFLEQYGYAVGVIEANDRSAVDSLSKITLNLTKSSDFHRQSNIYQSMVNSGQIKLLKNQQIIERLQHLEETYIYANKLEETHSEAIMTFAIPIIVSSLKVSNMTVEKVENLYTYQFQNLFTMFSGLMLEKNDIYQRALDRIAILNELIDEELGIENQEVNGN